MTTTKVRNPFVLDPPVEDAGLHRRADGRKSVLVQLWMPVTLRGQLRELAAEETQRRGKPVSVSDCLRMGARKVISERLQGV
jgi:hypothetical protein